MWFSIPIYLFIFGFEREKEQMEGTKGEESVDGNTWKRAGGCGSGT